MSSAEQPTPRCDAVKFEAEIELSDGYGRRDRFSRDCVDLSFARQLERELAACEARAYEAAAKVVEAKSDHPYDIFDALAGRIRSLAAAQRKEK